MTCGATVQKIKCDKGPISGDSKKENTMITQPKITKKLQKKKNTNKKKLQKIKKE
jgi:hypothetical protein